MDTSFDDISPLRPTMAARLELRMRKALGSGELYEAGELAQAAAQRHQREGNTQGAVSVLTECAVAQLRHPHVPGAVRRGVECAAAVLHLLNDSPAAPGGCDVVRSLVVAVVQGAEEEAAAEGGSQADATGGSAAHSLNTGSWGLHPDVAAAAHWLQSACTWTAGHGSAQDAAALHDALGDFLWRVARLRGLSDAALHLCQGTNTARFAAILAEAWAECTQDREWFVLRTVALLVACGGLHRVPTLLAALDQHRGDPAAEPGSPTEALVGNFTRLYVRALQADSPSLAAALRARYEALLGDDGHMEDLLDQAEARVWPQQAQQQQQGGGGGLASLLSALAG